MTGARAWSRREAPGPPAVRRLIVNGDDFGQSPGINEGIIRCHEQGILTSASLMVRWPAARAAAAYARRTPALSVGLHIDLGEWIHGEQGWAPLYSVVPTEDGAAVQAEVSRQLDLFRTMIGVDPTHLDSHQHVHRTGPLNHTLTDLGATLGVPVRHFSAVTYVGAFYGLDATGGVIQNALTADHLAAICDGLPAGTTELACHPGLGDDAPGMYVSLRSVEVSALCDPRVRSAIEAGGIRLLSFKEL